MAQEYPPTIGDGAGRNPNAALRPIYKEGKGGKVIDFYETGAEYGGIDLGALRDELGKLKDFSSLMSQYQAQLYNYGMGREAMRRQTTSVTGPGAWGHEQDMNQQIREDWHQRNPNPWKQSPPQYNLGQPKPDPQPGYQRNF